MSIIPNLTAENLGPKNAGNCGVTSVAIVAGRPFAEVFDLMRRQAKKRGNWKGSTTQHDRSKALDALGVKYHVDTNAKWHMTFAHWAERHAKPGTLYQITITGHVVTFKDGHYVDQTTRAPMPVKGSKVARKRLRRYPAAVVEILSAARRKPLEALPIVRRADYRRPQQLSFNL